MTDLVGTQIVGFLMHRLILFLFAAKISDVMTFSGTAAVPESWSVYRMIHFLDSPGFSIEPKKELVVTDKAYPLLWAWHFIMLLMPKVSETNQTPTTQETGLRGFRPGLIQTDLYSHRSRLED